jgi:hypothetical protein
MDNCKDKAMDFKKKQHLYKWNAWRKIEKIV